MGVGKCIIYAVIVSGRVNQQNITLPITISQGGASKCLEPISLKSVRDRRSTASEKE